MSLKTRNAQQELITLADGSLVVGELVIDGIGNVFASIPGQPGLVLVKQVKFNRARVRCLTDDEMTNEKRVNVYRRRPW